MSETLETMLEAMPDSYQKTVGFPTYDLLAAAAIPMDAFAQRLSDTERKLDPAELTGAELDSYIVSRSGLERNPATCAEGVLLVTGNGTVQTGDLFESGGGVQFASTQTVEITGSGEVPVRCVTPGTAGNLPANSITLMPVQIAGIVKVTNPAPTAEGYDAETDQAYYDRFILNLQTPPTSGNQYHYRSWALEVSGVGGVQVYPLGHGANTVDVVIIDTAGQRAAGAGGPGTHRPRQQGDRRGRGPRGRLLLCERGHGAGAGPVTDGDHDGRERGGAGDGGHQGGCGRIPAGDRICPGLCELRPDRGGDPGRAGGPGL